MKNENLTLEISGESFAKSVTLLALDVVVAHASSIPQRDSGLEEAIDIIKNYVAISSIIKTEGNRKKLGKQIAEKMLESSTMSSFAPRVAEMPFVTRNDLEELLPDYVSGGDITKLFRR